LAPGETWRYFTSTIYITAACFFAFTALAPIAWGLWRETGSEWHGWSREKRGDTAARLVAKLGAQLAGLWLGTGVFFIVFIGTLLWPVAWSGTLRNYAVGTVIGTVGWVTAKGLEKGLGMVKGAGAGTGAGLKTEEFLRLRWPEGTPGLPEVTREGKKAAAVIPVQPLSTG